MIIIAHMLRACLTLSVVLQWFSSVAGQEWSAEVERNDGGMPFCDESSGACYGSTSGEDSDDPSDWLGPHLLQTELHLHQRLATDVKKVQQHGQVNPELQNMHPNAIEGVVLKSDFQAWISNRISLIFGNSHLNPRRLSLLWLVFGIVLFLVYFFGIRAFYDMGVLWRLALCRQPECRSLSKCKNDDIVKLVESTDFIKKANQGVTCSAPEMTPECTTAPVAVQPPPGPRHYSCPAALRETSPDFKQTSEKSFEDELVADGKLPGSPWSGARFVLPQKTLDKSGSEPVHWTANGMSGKDFLRASINEVPENGNCNLVISTCSMTDSEFVHKWKFTKSPLTGVLPISGPQGEAYGTLEPVPGGRCLIKHEGNVCMSLEIENQVELRATASSASGRAIASSFKNSQEGSAPESGETWKVQVKPGADAIFIAGCMLAHMLLGIGAGAAAPAFSNLSK